MAVNRGVGDAQVRAAPPFSIYRTARLIETFAVHGVVLAGALFFAFPFYWLIITLAQDRRAAVYLAAGPHPLACRVEALRRRARGCPPRALLLQLALPGGSQRVGRSLLLFAGRLRLRPLPRARQPRALRGPAGDNDAARPRHHDSHSSWSFADWTGSIRCARSGSPPFWATPSSSSCCASSS